MWPWPHRVIDNQAPLEICKQGQLLGSDGMTVSRRENLLARTPDTVCEALESEDGRSRFNKISGRVKKAGAVAHA